MLIDFWFNQDEEWKLTASDICNFIFILAGVYTICETTKEAMYSYTSIAPLQVILRFLSHNKVNSIIFISNFPGSSDHRRLMHDNLMAFKYSSIYIISQQQRYFWLEQISKHIRFWSS